MSEPASSCSGPLPRGPLPGSPLPGSTEDADPEWAEYLRWLHREIAAGRDPEPVRWAPDDAWPPEPPEPADSVGAMFGQDGEADVLAPCPLLAGLTEQAVSDLGRLSDDELVGVLRATRRQVAREQYKQVLVTAEFGRRRQAAFEDAARREVPVGCRPGGFPGEELAIELATTRAEAGHRIDDAVDLTSRLPLTLAGMAAGQIDEVRAGWIAMYTRSLTPADAARADEVLAGAAPDLRVEQLARKAASLEMKLNPEAVLARREHAKRSEQRVEARRELSGNASLAGRELDTADVLASKAYIDAIAVKLRNSGLVDGTLARLRALAMIDLTQGRNPLDRINPSRASSHGQGGSPASPGSPGNPGSHDKPASPASAESPGSPASPASADSPASPASPASADSLGSPDGPHSPGWPGSARWPGWDPDQADPGLQDLQDRLADERDCRPGGPVRPGASAPLPALVNLLVPVGTLLGWSAAPAQAGPWGLLDAEETRAVVGAAAAHPRTRWCLTVTAPDGTALAHGCARGQHPRLLDGIEPQPPPRQLAELLRRLAVDFTPIARGSCDHAQAEAHYTPSRMLKHLVRARAATCDAPGCQAQASTADLDHTVPWPDGPTEQCNLAPRCRTHHRAKQAPDWSVEQAAPGVTRWRLPSGRVHVTTPTTYDL